MLDRFNSFWRNNKTFVIFICLMFVFRSAIADWNEVPTGSMKPTIIEGDRILVNKLAYDLRLPFTHVSLWRFADPERGDIIVFDSSATEKRMVKRVVGVPGDTVKMVENVVYLNDQPLTYSAIDGNAQSVDKIEHLQGVDHRVRFDKAGSAMSTFRTVTVPDGFYLALGDNRDNSADSRVIGFIARDEIVGRSSKVVISLNYNNFYMPRSDRIWHKLF